MKTRTGFVSNSSSSSFILKFTSEKQFEKKLNNLIKFFAEDTMNWEDTEEAKKIEYNKVKNAYKRLKRLSIYQDVLKGVLGIQFPSCGYNTYIMRIGETVYCATANRVQSFSLDNDWKYVDEGWHDTNPEWEALDAIIGASKYVSFNHDFKVLTYKEIQDMWNVEAIGSDKA